eukprot:TRINITY_DN26992_c0_g1_i1.p1 TRINITY_DN26992_c0_g1~~TRINITY_DN26992_c0_g1_i1.p1  ORF type:complete len:1017 (-),score=183.93 TRINITY_DN26992_c0_g1_i1:141-3191(-)
MEPASAEPVVRGVQRGSVMQQVKGKMFAPAGKRACKPTSWMLGTRRSVQEADIDLEMELKARKAAGKRRLMYRAMREALHDMKASQAKRNQPFRISLRLVAHLTRNAMSLLNRALFWKVFIDKQNVGTPSTKLRRRNVLNYLRAGHMAQLKSEGRLTFHAISKIVLSIIRMMNLGQKFGNKIVTVETSVQHLVEAVSRRIVKIVEKSMQEWETAEGVISDIRLVTEGMLKADLPIELKLLVQRLEDKVAKIQALRGFAGECLVQVQELGIDKASAKGQGGSAYSHATNDRMKQREMRALMHDLRWTVKKTRDQQVLLTETMDEVVQVAIQENPDQWGEDYHNGMPGRRNRDCLAGFDVAKIMWREVTGKMPWARGFVARGKEKDAAVSLPGSSEEEEEVTLGKESQRADLLIAGIGQIDSTPNNSVPKKHKRGTVRLGRPEVQHSGLLADHQTISNKPQNMIPTEEKTVHKLPKSGVHKYTKYSLDKKYVGNSDEILDDVRTAEEIITPSPPKASHPSSPRFARRTPSAGTERSASKSTHTDLEDINHKITLKRQSFLGKQSSWTRIEEAKPKQEVAPPSTIPSGSPVGAAPAVQSMPPLQHSTTQHPSAAEDVSQHKTPVLLTKPSDVVPVSARMASQMRSRMRSPNRSNLKGGSDIEHKLSELDELEEGPLPNQSRGRVRGSIIVHLPREWSPQSAQDSGKKEERPDATASSPRNSSRDQISQSGLDDKLSAKHLRAPADTFAQGDWRSLFSMTEVEESGESQWHALASQEIAAREQNIAELRQLLLMAQHESAIWQKQVKLLQAKQTPGYAQQSLNRATQWRQKDVENLKQEIQKLEMKNVSQQRHIASKRKVEMKKKKDQAFLSIQQAELESRMQSTQSSLKSHDSPRKRALGPRVDTLLEPCSRMAQLKLKKRTAKVDALGGLCSSARVRGGVEVHLWGWELDDFCFQEADLALASYVLPDVPVLSSRAAAFEAQLVQDVINDPDIGGDWTSSLAETSGMQRSLRSSQDVC